MTSNHLILHIFTDTNLFIQCRPLNELDWGRWSSYETVNLIVTRPIQREIDAHKNKGNDRLAQRARKTSSLFRSIILNQGNHHVIRDNNPRVILTINQELRPNPKLSEQLNYDEHDDNLVGIAHAFISTHPGIDALLLTNDTGPMASAKMVNIEIEPLPDNWLLPPERSENEKLIDRLKAEISRLQASEPDISIKLINTDGVVSDEIALQINRYKPINESTLRSSLLRLREAFPCVNNFGQEEISERACSIERLRRFGLTETFTPASHDEISEYLNKEYPAWIERCEKFLRAHHISLQNTQKWPTFKFEATNRGTRPASNTLVSIEAKGNFMLLAAGNAPPANEQPATPQTKLQPPPSPPQGRWMPATTKFDNQPLTMRLTKMFGDLAFPSTAVPTVNNFVQNREIAFPPISSPRSSDSFYWKHGRPDTARDSFSFECKMWRHSSTAESFQGTIVFDINLEKIKGILICAVHAENISKPVSVSIPVKIEVVSHDIDGIIENVVSDFIAKHRINN